MNTATRTIALIAMVGTASLIGGCFGHRYQQPTENSSQAVDAVDRTAQPQFQYCGTRQHIDANNRQYGLHQLYQTSTALGIVEHWEGPFGRYIDLVQQPDSTLCVLHIGADDEEGH